MIVSLMLAWWHNNCLIKQWWLSITTHNLLLAVSHAKCRCYCLCFWKDVITITYNACITNTCQIKSNVKNKYGSDFKMSTVQITCLPSVRNVLYCTLVFKMTWYSDKTKREFDLYVSVMFRIHQMADMHKVLFSCYGNVKS